MMRAKDLKIGTIVEAYFCDAEHPEWQRVQVIDITHGSYNGQWKNVARVRLAGALPGADTWLRRLKHLRECKDAS